MSNESYWQRDIRSVWHPYSKIAEIESEPFPTIVRGEGVYLFDADGNRYIDGISSWWACSLGHGHPRIVEAIKRQADALQHSMIGGMSHPVVIELAERLTAICPDMLNKVFFASDGSSAVEAAIKIATQYWQNIGKTSKTRFASIDGGYHGDTLGAVSVGMVESFHKAYRPLLFEAYKAESPYCYRCPKGKGSFGKGVSRNNDNDKRSFGKRVSRNNGILCEIECFASMEAIIEENREELAAVIVEPMNQAAAGMRIYPAGYLAKLRAACDRNKVLLIADEIAMGYGRSGKMFACEHAGIAPDILCLGKGMSAGYLPISATVVTEEIYSSFRDTPDADRTFYHGHTFTGNPIACAAAVETLKVFEEENVLGNMRPTMGVLADELAAFSELDCVGDVRQIGMVGAIELVADKREKTPFPSDMRLGRKICIEARRRGALLRPLGDVLYLWPPLNISNEQLRELAGILRKSIETALN